MQINVDFDTTVLDRTVARYEKNLAYSVAQAINAAALEAQKRIRASLRVAFHVRQGDFLDRSIKIFAFASVGQQRIYAELGIDNKPRSILSLFESGGQRLPFKGRSVAVPITGGAARTSMAASVNPGLTFQALNFQRGPLTGTGRQVLSGLKRAGFKRIRSLKGGQYYIWQGNQRTFILPTTRRSPSGGVFQRVGPKDVRMLYTFRKNVVVKKALAFVQTSQEAYEEVFQDTFVKRFFRLQ